MEPPITLLSELNPALAPKKLKPQKLEISADEILVDKKPLLDREPPDSISAGSSTLLRRADDAEVVDIHHVDIPIEKRERSASVMQPSLSGHPSILGQLLMHMLGRVHRPRETHRQGGQCGVKEILQTNAVLQTQPLTELLTSDCRQPKEACEIPADAQRVKVILQVDTRTEKADAVIIRATDLKPATALCRWKRNAIRHFEARIAPPRIGNQPERP